MSNSEVKAFAERIAALEAQKAEVASDINDVKLEVKQKGYDAALIAKLAKLINLDNEKRAKAFEQMDLFGSYIDQSGLR